MKIPYTHCSKFKVGHRLLVLAWMAMLAIAHGPVLHAQPQPLQGVTTQPAQQADQEPLAPKLSPVVRQFLDDKLLTPARRAELAIFHGQWDEVASPDISQQAQIALARSDLGHASLDDPAASAMVRAKALLLRGQPQQAVDLLQNDDAIEARWLVAEALMLQGELEPATQALTKIIADVSAMQSPTASQLTCQGKAVIELIRLQPSAQNPAQAYRTAIACFTRAYRDVDRLYYPAMVAEAKLLASHDNPAQAHEAISQAAALNPHDGQLWYTLGMMAAERFNFELSSRVTEHLRSINPNHLLADQLEGFALLVGRDAQQARQVIDKALERHPRQPQLLALATAAAAAAYDQDAFDQAMARFDENFLQSELALLTTGQVLSMNRQYARSEAMLRKAIEKRPSLPVAWVELGLLLMQSGDEAGALQALEKGTTLDPFNVRAANQLKLVRELMGYKTIETDHFIIRYHDGIDEALARDMPEALEGMYDDITSVFQHQPANKTLVEILPDVQRFAVRIIGIPEIWTIGAATGDVIAITPPRDGTGQRGAFDWYRVIRHEYVHTVTLSQTGNRIPHWFTEGAAVWQETGPRDDDTARLLAEALHRGELFALDEINWGFIRPKRQVDRPLAYAQACWMIQYIVHAHGQQAVVDMLTRFGQGQTDVQGIEAVTGQTAEAFMSGFHAWAREQVDAWGLGPSQIDERTLQLLGQPGQITQSVLDELLAAHPTDPQLLRVMAERALAGDDPQRARDALLRYNQARPVDSWAHLQLAQLALQSDTPLDAATYLAHLDSLQQHSGAYAVQLANLYRQHQQYEKAHGAMLRAIHREPYNATYREQAAAMALQMGDMQKALFQLQSLPLLEPDRAIHHIRLAALYTKLGQAELAHQSALAARSINPAAPVEKFLKKSE